MSDRIDYGMPRSCEKPCLGISRDAIARPYSECCQQCFTQCILSAADISRLRCQVCHQASIRLAGYALDGPMDVLAITSIHSTTLRFVLGASGRTSTAPAAAVGQRAAQSSAASSEGNSRIMNP